MFLEAAKASPKQSVGCMHAHMAIAHEDVAHLVLGKCFSHRARGILTDSKPPRFLSGMEPFGPEEARQRF